MSRITRNPVETRAALIRAARLELEEVGFEATNSNKIAARAGYAPQTFYRHFADKLEIFLAVYALWVGEEQAALDKARDAQGAAAVLIRHHRASLRLRRALRSLSVSDHRVRDARAGSRLQQIQRLRRRLTHLEDAPLDQLVASLLLIERLADACAEGEFIDVGLSASDGESQLASLLQQTLGRIEIAE